VRQGRLRSAISYTLLYFVGHDDNSRLCQLPHTRATTIARHSLRTFTVCGCLSASSTSCAHWSATSAYTGPQYTELPTERHLPGRKCGITASSACAQRRQSIRSHRVGDVTCDNGRSRLLCRGSTRSVAVHRSLVAFRRSLKTFLSIHVSLTPLN